MAKTLIYGVFDESMLSLRRRPADTVHSGLASALVEASSLVQDGPKDAKASVYVCWYDDKRDEAYPIEERGCITIEENGDWTPICDEDEEDGTMK